jgi:hypothetical protein
MNGWKLLLLLGFPRVYLAKLVSSIAAPSRCPNLSQKSLPTPLDTGCGTFVAKLVYAPEQMYGPQLFCKRKDEFGGLACANVFGLCWSVVCSGP